MADPRMMSSVGTVSSCGHQGSNTAYGLVDMHPLRLIVVVQTHSRWASIRGALNDFRRSLRMTLKITEGSDDLMADAALRGYFTQKESELCGGKNKL